MKRIPLSINFFSQQLQQNKHYSFARYGDGEMAAILGHYIKNADGVVIDASLQKQLAYVLLRQQPYYHGLLRIALTHYGPEIRKDWGFIAWYNGDMLLHQFLNGEGKPLLDQLQEKRILYVGAKHIKKLNLFPIVSYLETPESTAHKLDYSGNVIDAVHKYNIDFVGYSAGMASNLWISRVYDELGTTITQMDFGSLWDGFCGIVSRSYIKNTDFDKLKELYKR